MTLAWPFLLAAIPSLIYVFALRAIDRYEPEPRRLILAALVLGATLVPAVVIGLRVLVGQPSSLPLPYASAAPEPWVRIAEQLVCGLVLVAFVYAVRSDFDDALDGVVYGAAVGAGLGAAHTFLYGVAVGVGGSILLQPSTISAIVVSGLNQAFYCATFGAFLGYAYWYLRGRRQWLVIGLGLATAALLSALHDTLPYIISRVINQPDAATGVVTRLIASTLNVLGLIALAVVVVHFWRHEGNVLRRELRAEVANGAIDEADYDEVRSFRSRTKRQTQLLARGRFGDWVALRRLYLVEGKLAFHNWHARLARKGAKADSDADSRADQLRTQAQRLAKEVRGLDARS